MKYNILIILSLLAFSRVEAQKNASTQSKGFHLEVSIPTQTTKTLYLGQYWKGNTYAIDSVKLSDKGVGSFSYPDKPMPQGQYFLYIKPSFQADFLIGDEQNDIKLYIKENSLGENKVSGSKDTQLLWEYIDKAAQYDRQIDEKEKKLVERKTLTEPEIKNLEDEIKKLKEQKERYTVSLLKDNKNTWAGTFINGLQPVKLPFPNNESKEEVIKNRIYIKKHFFDNIDLNDPRLWRTNYLNETIDAYTTQWVEQSFDSIAAAASRLVAKTKDNEFCFKEMLSKFVNKSIASNVMGDENVWAKLFEEYIVDGNVAWIDSTQMAELRSMYERIKMNRIGMTAQNMELQTIDGGTINTNELDADYILLYFYDPGCGHCKTETPLIHNDIYKKYKSKGFEVVAINISSNKQEWESFVNDLKITDWINAADMDYKSKYWMNYDVSGVPSVYILDKNKRIIAKKIDEKNIKRIMDFYLQDKDGTN